MVVIRIDGNLFDDDFGVNHYEFQRVSAGTYAGKRDIEPSEIVENLGTPGQHPAFPVTA